MSYAVLAPSLARPATPPRVLNKLARASLKLCTAFNSAGCTTHPNFLSVFFFFRRSCLGAERVLQVGADGEGLHQERPGACGRVARTQRVRSGEHMLPCMLRFVPGSAKRQLLSRNVVTVFISLFGPPLYQ